MLLLHLGQVDCGSVLGSEAPWKTRTGCDDVRSHVAKHSAWVRRLQQLLNAKSWPMEYPSKQMSHMSVTFPLN
jgi:hypothetical protein